MAMISSCKFSSAPPNANTAHTAGMTNPCRLARRTVSQSTARRSAPVRSTTANAPPTRNTKNTMSAALIIPLGISTTALKGPAGCAGTGW